MLVAQGQYGYKWRKWITEIEVSNDRSHLGTGRAEATPRMHCTRISIIPIESLNSKYGAEFLGFTGSAYSGTS